MKAPKHLLIATKVKTCRNEVETYHVKLLNDLISYSSYIFKHEPLFFIIQDCVNQRKTFHLKVLLANNFLQFDKSPGKYTSKTHQVETKPVPKCIFFMKILVNTTALTTQMIISQSMVEKYMISETQTLDKDNIVSIYAFKRQI